MTWASSYTHAPTGERIDQYALPVQPMGPSRSAVRRSGFRHYRSTLQVGQTSDNLHIVEKWGEPVIPYEQWRFPFRPYAVPYGAWGPQAPYGIFNGQLRGTGLGQVPGYGIGDPRVRSLGVPAYGVDPRLGFPGPGTGMEPGGGVNPYAVPGNAAPGFPLQPTYQNQPWYDGNYPAAPPLDRRTDEQFFYHPPIGRPSS